METLINIAGLLTSLWALFWLYVVARWMWLNVPLWNREQ